jgi:hypothetical protein
VARCLLEVIPCNFNIKKPELKALINNCWVIYKSVNVFRFNIQHNLKNKKTFKPKFFENFWLLVFFESSTVWLFGLLTVWLFGLLTVRNINCSTYRSFNWSTARNINCSTYRSFNWSTARNITRSTVRTFNFLEHELIDCLRHLLIDFSKDFLRWLFDCSRRSTVPFKMANLKCPVCDFATFDKEEISNHVLNQHILVSDG